MKKWNQPELKNLTISETKVTLECSMNGATLDGHHTTKCHHGLPDINPSNCPYFTRPGGMCSYVPGPEEEGKPPIS